MAARLVVADAPAATVRYAEAVARSLGDGWAVRGAFVTASKIVHTDGRELHLSLTDGDSRVEVTGIRPPGTSGSDHRMTCDARPGPGHAAAAITSRLLRRYTVDHAAALARLAQRGSEWATRQATAAELVQIVPGAESTPDGLYVRWRSVDTGHGRVTVHGEGTVTVEIRDLPADVAARVLAVLGSDS